MRVTNTPERAVKSCQSIIVVVPEKKHCPARPAETVDMHKVQSSFRQYIKQPHTTHDGTMKRLL